MATGRPPSHPKGHITQDAGESVVMEKLQVSAPTGASITFHEFRSEVFRILAEDFQWHGGGNIRLFEKQEEMVRKAFYEGGQASETAQAVYDGTIRRHSKA